MRRVRIMIGAAICCAGCSDPAEQLSIDAAPSDTSDAPAVDAMPPAGMIAVATTTFTMGCHEALDGDCQADELPAHMVTVSGYWIDRDEVTQAAYAACMTCTPPSNSGVCAGVYDPLARPVRPVTCVSWDQATAYCAAVDKRLPTEAEWELAARGTDRRTYPWGEAAPTCTLVNYDGANGCDGELHDVGSHATGASPLGLLDMAGNAREFVADRYAVDYYASSPAMDPTGPATGLERVSRGGSAGSTLAASVRASERSPGGATAFEGFRCARSPD